VNIFGERSQEFWTALFGRTPDEHRIDLAGFFGAGQKRKDEYEGICR
jgi:hypothetical protein